MDSYEKSSAIKGPPNWDNLKELPLILVIFSSNFGLHFKKVIIKMVLLPESTAQKFVPDVARTHNCVVFDVLQSFKLSPSTLSLCLIPFLFAKTSNN